MTKKLVYRFATANDVTICNDFYNSNYNTTRSERQWAWEFIRPNSGELPFSIASQNDNVVGTQALIPIKFIDESGIFLTAKSEETLVCQSMRGKNLFENMYKPLFQIAVRKKIECIWGFTPADKAFRKIGFDVPCRSKQLLLVISSDALASLSGVESIGVFKSLLFRTLGSIASLIHNIKKFFAKSVLKDGEALIDLENAELFEDDFSKRFVSQWGGCTILRNKDYMSWRIFENPYIRANVIAIVKDGILLGYAAFSIDINRIGYLVDIIVAHPSGTQESGRLSHALILESTKRLKRMGATCVRAWTFNDHNFDVLIRSVAKSLGFLLINKGSSVVLHTNFWPSKPESSHLNFRNWYVTRIFTEGTQG